MRHRLHSICPYFAMFPESFVEEHVDAWTSPGDMVLDPFSGRGTTVFQSLLMDRAAAGSDVNPVAFCISAAKSSPPPLSDVQREISRLEERFRDEPQERFRTEREGLGPFFGRAFYWRTLDELLFLRSALDWPHDRVHTFIAALALGSLHGERDRSPSYFSNQMPRTISPKPDYAVRYWREHGLTPMRRKVFDILRQRAGFRLSQAVPNTVGTVRMADARLAGEVLSEFSGTVKAVVTSPPYYDVTNYEEDQWLRLWMLGYAPHPTYGRISSDDRHTRKAYYWQFLSEAWRGVAPLMRPDGLLVCRMGARRMAGSEIQEGLLHSVRQAFPNAVLERSPFESEIVGRQTNAFRPATKGCRYEWDYVVRLGDRKA